MGEIKSFTNAKKEKAKAKSANKIPRTSIESFKALQKIKLEVLQDIYEAIDEFLAEHGYDPALFDANPASLIMFDTKNTFDFLNLGEDYEMELIFDGEHNGIFHRIMIGSQYNNQTEYITSVASFFRLIDGVWEALEDDDKWKRVDDQGIFDDIDGMDVEFAD